MFPGCSYLTIVSSDRKGKCRGICNLSIASRHTVILLKNKPTKKHGKVRALES